MRSVGIKILIVDDSRVERNFLLGLLHKLGAQTAAADGCDEGVRLACSERYDLMLIDYFMPEADGVHTLREIRQNNDSLNRLTPAVALGTSDSLSDSEFFAEYGFENYLEKPVDFEMLHAALILYLPEDKRGGISAERTNVQQKEPVSVLPEWLDEIPELATADGVANCGTEEDYLGALRIFRKSVGTMSEEIERYYGEGDLKNYTIKVHALKSSARIIGLPELSELARKLEAAGDAGDTEFIEENTAELLEMYRSYSDKFSRLDEESSEEQNEKPPADRDLLDDAFSSLDEFAGQMDYDLVEMVIESVREYRLEPRDKALFDEADTAFTNLDWSGIRTAAQKYFENNRE